MPDEPKNALRRPKGNDQRNFLKDLPYPSVQATYLKPNQEAMYRSWLESIGHTQQNGYALDARYNGNDYDYRGFFAKYGPVDVRNGQHFTDEFKLPNHSTFSNESVYATGRAAPFAGSWQGSTYTPSPAQFVRGKRKFTE